MSSETMPAALAEAERRFGERPAIEDGDVCLTYADLGRQARAIAAAFMAAGVAKGDRVALWAPNSAEWISAALGIQIAGGVLIPLNTRLRGTEIAAILNLAHPRILVSCGHFLGSWYPDQLRGQNLPTLERILILNGEARDPAREQGWSDFVAAGEQISPESVESRMASIAPDDLLDIMFTSGTTGDPKGAMFMHRQTLAAADAQRRVTGMTERDRYCAFGPFSHTAAYKSGWATTLLAGALVFPQGAHDADSILRLVHERRVTMLPAPPPTYRAILDHPARDQFDLSSLRYAATGASSVPPEIYFRIKAELRVPRVARGYGLTECCGAATGAHDGDPIERVAYSSGRPIAGTELRISGEVGEELPAGATGEIWVRNRCIMLGYLDDPEATSAAVDAEGWLRTGDLGHVDADGYLHVTDRLKDMYIVGGFNVYPAEVEKLLEQMGGIAQSAVIGVPDARLGEVGRAFIVRRPGSTIDEAAVLSWCRDNMANFKAPRSVCFVESLPVNAIGKVLKQELRKLL